MKHEIGHALGLNHWGYRALPDQPLQNYLITTEKTMLADVFVDGSKYDYRPIDWEARASIYVGLNAVEADMRQAPPVAIFTHAYNVAVNAQDAAGHSLSNNGPGVIVIKATPLQYAGAAIEKRATAKGTPYYTLSLPGLAQPIVVQHDARLAAMRPDGSIEALENVKDLHQQAVLAAALKKGAPPAEKTPVDSTQITAPNAIPLLSPKNPARRP